ncbi:MAG: FkbM family methyltransferase [Chloroflexota bacterium]
MLLSFLRRTIIPPVWAVMRRLPGGVVFWQWCVNGLRVPPPFAFRPGTNDAETFQHVAVENEYRLPAAFRRDDIVVDIGAHIGSFCYAVLQRGARHVYGFEPDADNFACAVRNLQPFGARAQLFRQAVWRSDQPVQKLALARVDQNHAGVSALWGGDASLSGHSTVEAVALDDVLRTVTHHGQQRVRLLKLDCEASEFPIMLTARCLDWVDTICGEFQELSGPYSPIPIPEHFKVAGYDRFTITELTDAMQHAGFCVESMRHGQTNFGLFFATRAK